MLDLDDPGLLPNFLEIEDQPSAQDIKAMIDDWVPWNLMYATLHEPQYENSLYGPWNTLLSAIFPHRRQFVIKPQALLRRVVEEDLSDQDISIGSYEGRHESRTLPGHEDERLLPDFAPCKFQQVWADEDRSLIAERTYKLLCILELKRNAAFAGHARSQIITYVRRSQYHPNRQEPIFGYLVLGKTIQKFGMLGPLVAGPMGDAVDLNSREGRVYIDELCQLSADNWN
ncbi:hypothetical protein CPB83DRAFT_835395 [Crepidotus variabilis]|uniref:Uncharacterized protein n=1 Tax=Crepidotus variabilis TaxID=179855 RepID=A0A9P6EH06_9AGAR|nr:hypothetical protein CPB83DRAFT_835395 [Crepidotus variabilis]